MPGRIPTEEEIRSYINTCSNWNRWGAEDQMGAANHITPEKRRQAASLIKEGIPITCSRPIVHEVAADIIHSPPMHYMVDTGEKWAGKKNTTEIQNSSDFIGVFYHGQTITHIDSLCHIFWDGKMYNGYPAEKVTSKEGALVESIDVLQSGIVTRGVLIDVTKTKNVRWLEPGIGVFPEDLEEAEQALGFKVQPGDALFLRTGALRRRNDEGASNQIASGCPGYHAACLPWLYERQISVLGCDTPNDVLPSGYPQFRAPLHQIGIAAMGLWLIDNVNLEELAETCERLNRWEFFMVVAPLRISGGTGSPVNPIAVF